MKFGLSLPGKEEGVKALCWGPHPAREGGGAIKPEGNDQRNTSCDWNVNKKNKELNQLGWGGGWGKGKGET